MQFKPAFLVLVDISGYTRFMKFHATSLLHAEEIITTLLEAVIDRVEFPLTIAKLEGDAVFLYAELPEGREQSAAQSVVQQMEQMFLAFHSKERSLLACGHGCVCEACANIGQLKLKAFLDVGEVTIKQIRQFTEVTGPQVTLIHDLTKNTIPSSEYVAMTEAFHTLAGDYPGAIPNRHTEALEGFGTTSLWVYYPMVELTPQSVIVTRPGELAAALNNYSFGRMLRRIPSKQFNHLPPPKMNIVLYVLEGILSGLNIVNLTIQRVIAPAKFPVTPQ
jgi:class 3 adenylate cyclase